MLRLSFYSEFTKCRISGYPSPASLSSDSTLLPEPHRENCMTMNIDSGSFKVSSCMRTPYTATVPFVCKKVDNESCPTIDRGECFYAVFLIILKVFISVIYFSR